jgi:hypothetical protein
MILLTNLIRKPLIPPISLIKTIDDIDVRNILGFVCPIGQSIREEAVISCILLGLGDQLGYVSDEV